MLSANFKPKRTAAASCGGFLATARLSCVNIYLFILMFSLRTKRVLNYGADCERVGLQAFIEAFMRWTI